MSPSIRDCMLIFVFSERFLRSKFNRRAGEQPTKELEFRANFRTNIHQNDVDRP
ncbi:hypothetical protein X777_01324 [Ooceraea biroi]|uniref:Uncharacterized protein n=1 Tax=Ooceraea biroi TaxID=2015173 RepID=A0A026WQP6_OOCBI|nr:hypothetical protein X777_01324 [Ooceraea biroi]